MDGHGVSPTRRVIRKLDNFQNRPDYLNCQWNDRHHVRTWLQQNHPSNDATAGVHNSVPTARRVKSSMRLRVTNLPPAASLRPAPKPWPAAPESPPKRCIAWCRTRRRCSRAWCPTGSTNSCPTSACRSARMPTSKPGSTPRCWRTPTLRSTRMSSPFSASSCRRAGQFPDLAAAFYNNGLARTAAALANWLRIQVQRGLIDLDDAGEAAGMLIGMVASAPQRAAIYGGMELPSRAQIKARVRRCVKLFLRGCETQSAR